MSPTRQNLDFKTIEALKTGIKLEKEGLRAYLNFARETKDETGKNIFIILARDEVDHMEILERHLESHQQGGSWVKVQISESEIQKILPRIRKGTPKAEGRSGLNQLDALKMAEDLEKRSIEFYTTQAGLTKNELAREIFLKLASMEEAHYEIVLAELDSIQRMGFWFEIKEFTLEGEHG